MSFERIICHYFYLSLRNTHSVTLEANNLLLTLCVVVLSIMFEAFGTRNAKLL